MGARRPQVLNLSQLYCILPSLSFFPPTTTSTIPYLHSCHLMSPQLSLIPFPQRLFAWSTVNDLEPFTLPFRPEKMDNLLFSLLFIHSSASIPAPNINQRPKTSTSAKLREKASVPVRLCTIKKTTTSIAKLYPRRRDAANASKNVQLMKEMRDKVEIYTTSNQR